MKILIYLYLSIYIHTYCDTYILWCFYQLGLSFGLLFWWHPFTAEDPLINTFLKICSHKETHLHLGWPEGKHIYIYMKNRSIFFSMLRFLGPTINHQSSRLLIFTFPAEYYLPRSVCVDIIFSAPVLNLLSCSKHATDYFIFASGFHQIQIRKQRSFGNNAAELKIQQREIRLLFLWWFYTSVT